MGYNHGLVPTDTQKEMSYKYAATYEMLGLSEKEVKKGDLVDQRTLNALGNQVSSVVGDFASGKKDYGKAAELGINILFTALSAKQEADKRKREEQARALRLIQRKKAIVRFIVAGICYVNYGNFSDAILQRLLGCISRNGLVTTPEETLGIISQTYHEFKKCMRFNELPFIDHDKDLKKGLPEVADIIISLCNTNSPSVQERATEFYYAVTHCFRLTSAMRINNISKRQVIFNDVDAIASLAMLEVIDPNASKDVKLAYASYSFGNNPFDDVTQQQMGAIEDMTLGISHSGVELMEPKKFDTNFTRAVEVVQATFNPSNDRDNNELVFNHLRQKKDEIANKAQLK